MPPAADQQEPEHAPEESARTVEAIVSFFRELPEAARQEYAALAELDRRFGEDVAAERAARTGRTRTGDER